MTQADKTITHRCRPEGECFCVYDPDCNPTVKAAQDARIERAARWLADEFGMTDEFDGLVGDTPYDAGYWKHLVTGVLNVEKQP